MNKRQEWGTRSGFILAAIGSAIGLGNIWRFPAVAYENGGGAFFLPYLFALLTAGIPLLIMEFTLGHKFRGSSPLTFSRLNKKTEWLGWWQLAITFVISTYYAAIIAWSMSYSIFSFNLNWGKDPEGFLYGSYLKLAETPGEIGGVVPGVLIPLILVWVVTLSVLFKGVKKGIEKANKVMLPTLIILFLIIVIRALSLEGATQGLEAFFKPNWALIANPKVWVAAYGQIFFSLSIGFAIMITYSSYLPKKTEITNSAFITGFANSGFELLSGIGVFAALGFMANQQNVPVNEVVSAGVGLAFVVFPKIINEFPAFNGFFGFAFFGCLTLAGLTSMISIVETYVAGIQEKFKMSRTKALMFGGGLSAVFSILFATHSGLYILDSVDYFINQFGVVLTGLTEVVLVAWVLKQLKPLQLHANSVSDIMIGTKWRLCLGVVTPIILGFMTIQNIISVVKDNYGGYPTSFLIYSGWLVAIVAFSIGLLFMKFKWDQSILDVNEQKEAA
ncbi:sodium-dependent transporter [Bacillus massilinigeriensis]|uniref:sodium-dependent transporter n=1 Tax=Bacillus massilionigeriensis TaxID=1805475 RepID=UPI00096B090A|nr:sodium-dependent transporter [Bacillus massilionigeriensis]